MEVNYEGVTFYSYLQATTIKIIKGDELGFQVGNKPAIG